MPSFSQVALAPESLALQHLLRAFVVRIDVGFEPMQLQRVEREPDQSAHRVCGQPLAPAVAPERKADLRAPVGEIDIEQGARPEDLVLPRGDSPLKETALLERGADLLDQLRGVVQAGQRHRAPVPHDLRVPKDREDRRGVAVREWTKPDAAAVDARQLVTPRERSDCVH
jgi:hypothetical protein